MQVAVFSTKSYDRLFLEAANLAQGQPHQLTFLEPRLTPETTALAKGCPSICAFVNDQLSAPVLQTLAEGGTRLIALRSAGFNHVDLVAARDLNLTIVRVPAYSPSGVAEHAVALILALNRKVPRAYNRVRDGNLSLEGLLGFNLDGRTVGIIGTGKIGTIFARIMRGFNCRLLAVDPHPNEECRSYGVSYVDRDRLLAEADIIALHCPLTPDSYHMIDDAALQRMKPGAMLINTSRGALIDTPAVIEALKTGKLAYLGLDVYEEEEDLFFEDLSDRVIRDDVFSRLLTFPNVLITGHQAFFTEEAMRNIADTTIANITAYERGTGEMHEVSADRVMA
jgi:D-lactate dehydrogenase